MCHRPPLRISCLLGMREGFAGGANLGTGRDKIKARVRAFISCCLSITALPQAVEPCLRLPASNGAHPAGPTPAFPESLSEYGPTWPAVLSPCQVSWAQCWENSQKPPLFAPSGLPACRVIERNPRARACFSTLPTACCPLAFHAAVRAAHRSSAPARPPAG